MKLALILVCILAIASSKTLSYPCQKGLENIFTETLQIAEEIKDGSANIKKIFD